jgi:hypothetical protein
VRQQTGKYLEAHRVTTGPMGTKRADGFNGAFIVGPTKAQQPDDDPTGLVTEMRCIVSNGGGWDHVSVTYNDGRPCTPTWGEMALVKDLFFDQHETVVQFHPAATAYVNCHPHCLHLWRCQDRPMPCPPGWMVAPPLSPDVQRRNDVLTRLDETEIREYYAGRGLTPPADPDQFWAAVHKARVNIGTLPDHVRRQSEQWLLARGISTQINVLPKGGAQ